MSKANMPRAISLALWTLLWGHLVVLLITISRSYFGGAPLTKNDGFDSVDIFTMQFHLNILFFRSCLRIRPKDRIQMSEILQHPWIVESEDETKSLEKNFHQMSLSTESL